MEYLITTYLNGQNTVIFTGSYRLLKVADAELFVMTPSALGATMFIRVCQNDTLPEGGAVQHLDSYDLSAVGRYQKAIIDSPTLLNPGQMLAVSFEGDSLMFQGLLSVFLTDE